MNAAGEWNYDIDAAPKDGTRVLLGWRCEGAVYADVFHYREDEYSECVWWSDSIFLESKDVFAWAAINVPDVPK